MSDSVAALFQRLTQGVYVVGVAHGEVRNAFTAAWVMQVSFDPLLLALSINPHHSSYGRDPPPFGCAQARCPPSARRRAHRLRPHPGRGSRAPRCGSGRPRSSTVTGTPAARHRGSDTREARPARPAPRHWPARPARPSHSRASPRQQLGHRRPVLVRRTRRNACRRRHCGPAEVRVDPARVHDAPHAEGRYMPTHSERRRLRGRQRASARDPRVASAATPMVSTPMSSPTVAHLHVHSEYSLLDGACNIGKLAERAAAFDQPAIGLTDHGVMNGAVELYKAAKKHNVKPLLGLEAYFVDDRHVRDRKVERNHLTLLAANNEGFKNLTTLSSKGFLEGLHRGKPGVDLELLVDALRGRHRALGLPGEPHEPADHGRAHRRGARASGRADPDLRPRGRLSRGPEERPDRAGPGQRGDEALRGRDGPVAGRHGRRALPAQGGLPPPRGAAVRADEVDAGRAEDVVLAPTSSI